MPNELDEATQEEVITDEDEKLLVTVLGLLQRVQQWRNSDGNDGFPHGLRVDIDETLRAAADTAVDAPVPPKL